jgi:choline dehydrogenase-like flavoprotein
VVARAEVCVIGGGPAGLAVAAGLAAAGRDVLVVEAGGLPYDRTDTARLGAIVRDHLTGAQSMNRGRNTGMPYFALRFAGATGLGGSANALKAHGLRARPLDPIDFDRGPGRRWPIGYEELVAHLPAAEQLCGLTPGGAWDPAPLAAELPSRLRAAPVRHGRRAALPTLGTSLQHQGVRMVLHTTVVGFEVDGPRITAAWGRTQDGTDIVIRADRFVVAAAGINTARLLLASPGVLRLLGPAAAHVGRGFMEHPHLLAGHLLPSSPQAARALQARFGGREPDNILTLDDDTVRDEALYRAGFVVIGASPHSLRPGAAAARSLSLMTPYGPFHARRRLAEVAEVIRSAHHLAPALASKAERMVAGSLHPGAPRSDPPALFALHAMTEQPRRPGSRVRVGRHRHRSGLPRPELNWEVSEPERSSLQQTVQVVGEEIERLGWGSVRPSGAAAGRPFGIVRGGWHQLGTMAMADDPGQGVVDPDCRVFGTDNLFVAGSSVFPTSGYANPTLTLVALALRLAVHLGGSIPPLVEGSAGASDRDGSAVDRGGVDARQPSGAGGRVTP